MSTHEWGDPYDTVEDALARSEDYERIMDEDARYMAGLDRREVTPDPRPEKRTLRRNAPKPGIDWRWKVLERDAGCISCADPTTCAEGWQAHHPVPQQRLREEHPEALWSIDAGIGLCGRAHRRFHAGLLTIHREQLPASVVAYLESLGYGWYLEAHYPSEQVAA